VYIGSDLWAPGYDSSTVGVNEKNVKTIVNFQQVTETGQNDEPNWIYTPIGRCYSRCRRHNHSGIFPQAENILMVVHGDFDNPR
jgi:hypothetical protein